MKRLGITAILSPSSFTVDPSTQAYPGYTGPGNCLSITTDMTFNFIASVTDQNASVTGQRTGDGHSNTDPGGSVISLMRSSGRVTRNVRAACNQFPLAF